MRKALIIFSITLLLTSCSQNLKPGVNIEANEHFSYTLELVDGKVISPDCSWVVCIEKKQGQDFTILNFADVQLSRDQYSSQYKSEVDLFKASSESLTQKFSPDLITLSGDQSYGDLKMLKDVCDQMDALDKPWAIVFGNHDNEQQQLTLKQQSELFESYENCLYKEGPGGLATTSDKPTDAIGNYVVNIVEIEGETFRVVKSLIFFNSGGSNFNYASEEYQNQKRYHNYSYPSLSKAQISWYKDMVESVQAYGNGEVVSSGVILHMPPYVFLQAAEAAYNTDVDIFNVSEHMAELQKISYQDSYNEDVWNDGYKQSFGMMHEPYGGTPYPDGFFDAVKELGSTDFILAGHEHINNYCINYEGVNIVYAMKTGTGAYCEDSVIGGTIITITDDGTATIRHELDHNKT